MPYHQSIHARAARPKQIATHIRTIFEERRDGNDSVRFYHEMRNAATFMRAQRTHKALLERYQPLAGISTEERNERTAHRVGLNMPLPVKPNGEE
ncbi:hypothetical protein VTO73DRAFT_14782 [Trametes versicolor]